jgi:parallel beta-helix repeat protein
MAGNNVSHNPGEGFLLMDNSDGNTITDNMVDSNGEGGGIVLLGSGGLNEDNVIANNTITNNPNGIYLSNSSGNTIVNCTIRDSTSYYFYSDSNSGNAVYDTYINTSKVSFTGLDIAIRAVEDPPTAPFDLYSIGKYLNISNNSAGSWIFLNMSYVEADLYVNESTLRMYRHDGAWEEVPEPNGVNTIDDYVYANITSFSVFAPNGDVAVAAPWHLCLCGKPWRWHHNRH